MGNKVIYRPAYDAEVEYLESTGTQWIDTGVKPTNKTKWELDALLKKANVFQQMGSFLSNPSFSRFGIGIETSGRFNMSYGNPDNITNIISDELRHLFVINAIDKTWTIDDTSGNYDSQESIVASMPNICLFARGTTSGANRFITNGRIYKSKIWDNSTLVRDFIPVRIGSVGYLYDKVTKQLFANKGTGNFILGNDVSNAVIPQQRCVLYFGSQRSVIYERIYEEYEWLVGDGVATITHKDVDTFEVKVLELDTTGAYYAYGHTNDSIRTLRLYIGHGVSSSSNYSGLFIYNLQATGLVANYRSPSLNINLGEHIITKNTDTNQIGVFTDGVRHIYNSPSTDIEYVGTNIIFNQLVPNQNLYIGYLSSPNIHNLVPCKLLQSIPASMDANGIARPSGICGMWDKVNDVFYGNVASSGSFSVSND